jgi:glycosyltransferase involved in cell wall biosynthesis
VNADASTRDAQPARRPNQPVVAITYRGMGKPTDAILAYSRRLTEAIGGIDGFDARLVVGDPAGWTSGTGAAATRMLPAIDGADGVLLQYNPFSYGRWGFAPWLLRDLQRLRRRGVPLGIMVHEAYLRAETPREVPLSIWQWMQFRTILSQVDVVLASTETLVRIIGRLAPGIPLHHVPVGSNLPDRRAARDSMRRQLGLSDRDVALVAFRTGHPSQLGSSLTRAARAAAEESAVLLNLGAGAPPIPDVPPGTRVITPGPLSETELAEWLAAGDLFVAPFSDGVSTRRTTVMAALQHELPVVTTRGPNTDRVFRESPHALHLVDAEKPDDLEHVVRALARDATARQASGSAARQFYERHFEWSVIARTVRDALGTAWTGLPTGRPGS